MAPEAHHPATPPKGGQATVLNDLPSLIGEYSGNMQVAEEVERGIFARCAAKHLHASRD